MDIIERLRAKRVRGRPGFYNPDELCQEAADQIARLTAELDALRADNAKLDAQLNAVLGHMDDGAISDLRAMLDDATKRTNEQRKPLDLPSQGTSL